MKKEQHEDLSPLLLLPTAIATVTVRCILLSDVFDKFNVCRHMPLAGAVARWTFSVRSANGVFTQLPKVFITAISVAIAAPEIKFLCRKLCARWYAVRKFQKNHSPAECGGPKFVHTNK